MLGIRPERNQKEKDKREEKKSNYDRKGVGKNFTVEAI